MPTEPKPPLAMAELPKPPEYGSARTVTAASTSSSSRGRGRGRDRDRGRGRIRALTVAVTVALQRVGGCTVDGVVVLDGGAIVAHL